MNSQNLIVLLTKKLEFLISDYIEEYKHELGLILEIFKEFLRLDNTRIKKWINQYLIMLLTEGVN